MKHPHRYEVPLTEEELAQARLELLEQSEFSLLKALRAGGIGTTFSGAGYIALTDQCLCSDPLPVDPESPDFSRPRIYPRKLHCVLHDVEHSVRQVTDRWRKTPAQAQKYLAKAQPSVLPLPDFYDIEAGEDLSRRGVSTDLRQALSEAGARPGEKVRGCLIRCRDAELASEIADTKRDELPWVEDLKFREDGTLPADWHRGPLSVVEQLELERQQAEDAAAKRARRDRVIRQMMREPI